MLDTRPLDALPKDVPRHLFFTGKGGVGKTTTAAALAVALADRGKTVHLSTTDPAATLDGASVPGPQVDRIAPQAETQRYIDKVMASRSRGLDEAARALMLEDLRSLCTEEVAALQEDLKRARIEPFAWVVNRSLAASGTTSPVLAGRIAGERVQMQRVAAGLAPQTFVVPWNAQPPIGVNALRRPEAGEAAAQ